ncbi:MAG: type I restriction enzyme HsdR N-terminal domain-containing protein [Bifidobacterium psychraerophilum]|jgi:hypothetical protein|uniref:type I restriction endonuclease n=1 Tax=Bifidobacterium psychraerophilum TaxID=218140 RepID=UPI0039ED13E7
MEFEESVNQIAAKVRDLKPTIETEEATKNAFIMPFIGTVLGYDVFNPNEVIPEFIADVGLKRGEKIDYALVHEGQVQILIECKKVGVPLSLENAGQLFRYFAVTDARIGVLTNGQVWNFYMDIDAPNKMDSKPFLVLDLLDVDETILPELKKLTKPAFDVESIANSAEELKYVGSLKRTVADEFRSPSDEFVKMLAAHVFEGQFRQSVMDKFRPLVEKALKRYLADQVNDRLKTALGADDVKIGSIPEGSDDPDAGDIEEEEAPEDSAIETTDEEIAGYRIVKAIACSVVDPSRIVMRDAKSYCAVLLDDNNRKPIVRLFFNSKQKYVGVFDENKNCERLPIDDLNGIYQYSEQIRDEVTRLTA